MRQRLTLVAITLAAFIAVNIILIVISNLLWR